MYLFRITFLTLTNYTLTLLTFNVFELTILTFISLGLKFLAVSLAGKDVRSANKFRKSQIRKYADKKKFLN
jgi:hypothetical protein